MNEIKEAIERALPKIANRMQSELILTCPVDTGRLRNSILVKADGMTLIITMVDYGIYVEFGTKNQRPNPFIRNCLNNKIRKIIVEEILKSF